MIISIVAKKAFDKGGKNIQWRKIISLISDTGRTGQSSVKE